MPIPIRSCIACRKATNWRELLRVVAIEGQVTPDPNRRKGGRGAWLHRECLDMAKQRRSFQRAFRTDENLSIDLLEEYFKDLN
jgi:predicted RNA-binding protein YlxR (DUF448 family)